MCFLQGKVRRGHQVLCVDQWQRNEKWGVTWSKTCMERRGHNGRNWPLGTEPALLQMWVGEKRNQASRRPGQASEDPRHCLGTVALQEICQYQKTTDLLIWKLLFAHLIWELNQEYYLRNLTMESYNWKGWYWGSAGDKLICTGRTIRRCKPLNYLWDLQLALHLRGHSPIKWRNGDEVSWI